MDCHVGFSSLVRVSPGSRAIALAIGLAVGLTAPVAAQDRGGRKVELPGPSDVPPAAEVDRPAPKNVADYRSAHFEIHTDLPSGEARRLLRRLETLLRTISKYWDQPLDGRIECYVVKDLANWPEGSLDPVGRAKIAQGAGITMVEALTLGRQTLAAKAVVYAVADRGTPQHEAVHAYCGQTFGRVGPLWYAEGMAELANYWRPGDASVECPDYVIKHIRSNRPKPLRAIVSEDGLDRPGRPAAATGDSWQNYAWRWALCHLLENNPNYSERFRPLGLGYLNDQPVSFADAYGPVMRELAFEYRQFVTHLDNGFRVDLCRWDWSHKFKEPAEDVVTSRIAARRGWQPSGAIVAAGQAYDYSASGAWRVSKDDANVTADGRRDGAGRLEGVVFDDFRLGEPFSLGDYGTFRPTGSGRLYLRCRDAWNELADNRGSMRVQVTLSAAGPALPQPTDGVDESADSE